jgi:short-subunit dehydrogenase
MTASPETVLITGASSGIGRELAHCFARAGSDCVLLARTEEALHELADTLESSHGITASVLPADLSTPGVAPDVKHQLNDRDLSVDVLVNNAGFGARGRFAALDPQQQVDMIRVNVTALTDLTRRLLPAMLDRNRGGVLNVASTAAFQPGPFMSVYYATKAYVLSFSEGLTDEVANTNVTVSCLAPGPTRTAFIDEAGMNDAALFEWGTPMTATAVAEAGYNGFRAGRALTVPGWPNKMGAFMIRFTPRSVARGVAGWLNR